jgi:hypothetical protein
VYPPVVQQGLQSRLTVDWTQPISFRFLAPQIADAIYGKYFDSKRMQGMPDPEFINRVNGTLVCLTCAILCHQLRAWRSGVFQDPPYFKPDAVGGRNPGVPTYWVYSDG